MFEAKDLYELDSDLKVRLLDVASPPWDSLSFKEKDIWQKKADEVNEGLRGDIDEH